jgi:hypothetical protein
VGARVIGDAEGGLVGVSVTLVEGAVVEGDWVTGLFVEGDVVEGAVVKGAFVAGTFVEGEVVEGAVVEGVVVEGDWVTGLFVEGAVVEGDVEGAVVTGAFVAGAFVMGAKVEGVVVEGDLVTGPLVEGNVVEGAVEGDWVTGPLVEGLVVTGVDPGAAVGAFVEGAVVGEAVLQQMQLVRTGVGAPAHAPGVCPFVLQVVRVAEELQTAVTSAVLRFKAVPVMLNVCSLLTRAKEADTEPLNLGLEVNTNDVRVAGRETAGRVPEICTLLVKVNEMRLLMLKSCDGRLPDIAIFCKLMEVSEESPEIKVGMVPPAPSILPTPFTVRPTMLLTGPTKGAAPVNGVQVAHVTEFAAEPCVVGLPPQTMGLPPGWLGEKLTSQLAVVSQLLVGPMGAGHENGVAGYTVGAALADPASGLSWLQPPLLPLGVVIERQFIKLSSPTEKSWQKACDLHTSSVTRATIIIF